jgi:hypothetical protein
MSGTATLAVRHARERRKHPRPQRPRLQHQRQHLQPELHVWTAPTPASLWAPTPPHGALRIHGPRPLPPPGRVDRLHPPRRVGTMWFRCGSFLRLADRHLPQRRGDQRGHAALLHRPLPPGRCACSRCPSRTTAPLWYTYNPDFPAGEILAPEEAYSSSFRRVRRARRPSRGAVQLLERPAVRVHAARAVCAAALGPRQPRPCRPSSARPWTCASSSPWSPGCPCWALTPTGFPAGAARPSPRSCPSPSRTWGADPFGPPGNGGFDPREGLEKSPLSAGTTGTAPTGRTIRLQRAVAVARHQRQRPV